MYKKASPFPIALRYGLIMSAVMVFLMVLTYITNIIENPIWFVLNGLVSIIIMSIILYVAIKKHRDEEQEGFITLGKAVGVGALVSLVYAIVGGIFNLILNEFIDPDLTERISISFAEWMADLIGDDSVIDQTEERMEENNNYFNFFSGLFGIPCCSAVISLIFGLILQKEPSDIRL